MLAPVAESPIPSERQQYPAIPPVDYDARFYYQVSFPLAHDAPTKANVATVRVPGTQARSWRITLSSPQSVEGDPLYSSTFGFGATPMIAIVTWGCDKGKTMVAEVDWSRGRSFVVHGTSVNVDVQIAADYSSLIVGAAAVQARAVTVGCTIVPANDDGAPSDPPTRSVFTGSIAGAGAVAVVRIPPFARRVRWYVLTQPSGGPSPLRIDAADDFAFTHIRQSSPTGVLTTAPPGMVSFGGAPDEGLPIETTCLWLAVTNDEAMAGDAVSLWLEFVLDLG